MTKNNKLLFYLVLSACLGICFSSFSHNQASHKRENLDNYLDNIGSNLEEKTHIISYMRKNLGGNYLEIGTGGDTISYILKSLPKDYRGTVIASDVDQEILDAIPKRHPELQEYLDGSASSSLVLMKLDATQMGAIKNNSLSGINASAIAHEIVSYVPPRTALSQFFIESARSLEKNGVFIYRDPATQDNPAEINTLMLENPIAKRFAILFFSRFLDRNYTHITDMQGACAKPDFKYVESLRIYASINGKVSQEVLGYYDFLEKPSSSFNFSAPLSIQAPRRLLNEFQRHYVLFLKDVFPQAFSSAKALQTGKNILRETPVLAHKVLLEKIDSLNLNFNDDSLSSEEHSLFIKEHKNLEELIAKGSIWQGKDINAVDDLNQYLKDHKASPTLYSIVDSDRIWLDAKLNAILYRGKNQGIMKRLELLDSDDFPDESLDWLQREGDEHYFYYDLSEFLAFLLQLSDYYFPLIGKEGYIFAPIDSDAIYSLSRELYQETLERDMCQFNMCGQNQEFVTDKRVLHLQLMPREEGIKILGNLVKTYPEKYEKLANALQQKDHHVF
ncbi:MAG: hypothetical protein ACQEP8_03035 [Chlamydiota bacterium]